MMVIGILIMLALALAFVLFFNYSQKKILKEQMKNQQLAFDHQETLLHSTILTQEKERKRIARELHDEIGSKLNIILLNTYRLKKFRKDNSELEEIASEVNSVIHKTIETTRRISHDLLPPTLEEFGFVEAVKELRDSFIKTGNISINLDLIEISMKISEHIVELNLFRVLQELINNSIKHGKATEIFIKLWLTSTRVRLEYRDNGSGFDMTNFANMKGLGTKNIESRLNMINSDYQYNSELGSGFSIAIELKMDQLKLKAI
jgi:signal transduction histidine kinase